VALGGRRPAEYGQFGRVRTPSEPPETEAKPKVPGQKPSKTARVQVVIGEFYTKILKTNPNRWFCTIFKAAAQPGPAYSDHPRGETSPQAPDLIEEF